MTRLLIHSILFSLLTCNLLSANLQKNHLYIQEKKVQLQYSIIQKNNDYYIPLRECINAISAELHFQKRDLRYKLTLYPEGNICYILPNSREFWIGNTQQFFSDPPFTKDRILYVPTKAFFKYIGYSVHIKNNTLRLNLKKKNTIIKTTRQYNQTLGSSGPPPILTETTLFPNLSSHDPFYVAIGTDVIEMTQHFFYKKGILFIHPTIIFKHSNYDLEETSEHYILKQRNKTYHFNKHNRTLKITQKTKTETRTLEHAPIHKNGKIYFPIQSMLSLLDLSITWDSKKRLISILNKLKKVSVIPEKDSAFIQIKSTLPITKEEEDFFETEKGFQAQIPFTKIRVQTMKFFVQDPKIKKIELSEQNKNTAMINIITNGPYKKSPYLTSTDTGAEIRFYNQLENFQETHINKKLYISIKANTKLKYKLIADPQKHKLHFHFNQALSKIPEFIRAKSIYIDTIQTKTIHGKTPTTILSIQLKNKAKLHRHKFVNDTLKMTIFPLPNQVKPHRVVKKKKTVIKKNLTDRIIAIDAGHGGRDPGGIGKNRAYEKNFTLKIAKILQKRLQNDGANVIMSRTKDKNTSLVQRTRQANLSKADIFISIHMNSFKNNKANGTETYFYKKNDKKLALNLQKELTKTLKLKDNGLKRNRLYVLKYSKMPAALVEPGFLTNPKDYNKLSKKNTSEEIAQAIHRGILNYYK